MIELQEPDVRNSNTHAETETTYTLGEIQFAGSTVKARKVELFNGRFRLDLIYCYCIEL